MTAIPTTEKEFSIDDYRALFRNHPAAVAIVTLQGSDHPVGFTATSVVSVSADPAVIMFSIMAGSSSWPELCRAESVVLHFLDHRDVALAQRFATSGINRFAEVEWLTIATGEPLLAFHGAWVRCRVLGFQQVGGSFLVQVEPTHAVIEPERSPLVYHERNYHQVSAGTRIDH
jgi:flavin reductase (DIM6/NTAB) family NADH-FMN oxidoreductase RutF